MTEHYFQQLILKNLFNISFSENLPELSCTNLRCEWIIKQCKNAADSYGPRPLEQRPCFSDSPPTLEPSLKKLIKDLPKKSNKDPIQKSVLSDISNKCSDVTKSINSKSRVIK